jgi:hypothetical protein
MSRIDVQTLVMAFEKRIEMLEKNPPDKISTGVVVKLLENSIGEVIKEHFVHIVKKELEEAIHKEFKKMKSAFIEKTLKDILTDDAFREGFRDKIKKSILNNI